MDKHYTYLLVDLGCLLFPFLFSFHPAFKFYTTWKAFLPACLITALIFITWDILFTYLGVWSFNPDYTLTPRFINLPVEELLFFIFIPYACVFTYHCLKLYLAREINTRLSRAISLLLIIVLLSLAFLNLFRLYTSVTFILLSITLLIVLIKKLPFLSRFFIGFILILPFFFLSNGILTGSFTEEAVVNYAPHHNIGIRMFTIPVEDLFYGMLLLLLNIILFEWFSEKQSA